MAVILSAAKNPRILLMQPHKLRVPHPFAASSRMGGMNKFNPAEITCAN
jgi:hypothetical protein